MLRQLWIHVRGIARPAGAFLSVLALCTVAAEAGLPVQPDPGVEAKVDSLVRAAVDHAFAGRLDLGLQTVDLAEEVAPRDPRVGLTRFRLLRENYPVSVFEKERAREQEPALIRELEQCIAICDSMLEVDETNAAAYLYRGWAYINKAQTQLIARRLRAAAGSSRHGKSDFDRFYKYHPEGDPDAATVLGAFLFYADTLPGFFKFIRWLIRVPGGDRERGLALLREGAAGRGYTYPDAVMVLGVTYYLFDGNLEDASSILRDAVERYPRHPWIVEYTCSMSYLFPEFTGRAVAYESAVLDGWNETTRGWDEAVRYRLMWSLGRQYQQLGDFDAALEKMSEIVIDSPTAPSAIAPKTQLSAIELAGNLGREHDVRWLCERIPDEKRYRDREKSFAAACGSVAEWEQARAYAALGPARMALYSGNVEDAVELIQESVTTFGSTTDTRYLEAEVARQSGRWEEAAVLYAGVAADASETGRRALRVQSLIRLGEIHIRFGDYEAAKDAYESAKDAEPGTTMLSNFIRGRIRYIEREKD
jgi:tetratricopeptide (TPR) repeat protein